ncbi:MAG TPA: hypothetical protein VGC41_15830, partial [Kofleriaceae bacterium]
STGPSASWEAFLSTEWAAAIGSEDTVTYQVRGIQSANPAAGVGTAGPRLVKLTNEEMLGGIYYWASQAVDMNGVSDPTSEGIWRHDMSKPGEPAERFETVSDLQAASVPHTCIACHVLSRDGTRMAVSWDGGDQKSTTLDVGTKTFSTTDTNSWNFSTFTPDGNKLLTVEGGVLVVRDYMTQAIVASPVFAGFVSHPDLSPDGTQLVYVRHATGGDYAFPDGKIYTRSYDQATDTFGTETVLVDDAMNNYYPSYSPDGKWVLFNKSDGSSYNSDGATVYVIPADKSTAAVQLANLNVAGGLTNSWARWAPFQQTVGAEPVYWVTVSSQRNFGTRIDQAARVTAGLTKRPQIWMSAFVPSVASAAMDPSQPSFRLPFQNIETNNHIAQWTERVVVTQ